MTDNTAAFEPALPSKPSPKVDSKPADDQEKVVSEHVTTLHLIGEQLSQIESWFWQHLADVRDAEPAAVPPVDRAAVLLEAADDLATAFGDPMVKHIGLIAASHLRHRAREIEAGQDKLRQMAAEAQQQKPTTADRAAALGMTDTEYRAQSHQAAVAAIRAALPGLYASVGFRVEDALAEAQQQPETRDAIARVRALHVPSSYPNPDGPGEITYCLGCEHATGGYPCNTLAALDEQPASGPGGVADEAQQQPDSEAHTETDEERADREETERDHAAGNHQYCDQTCEVEFPTDMLRNTILYRAIPGSKAMLAELERRAACRQPAPAQPAGPATDDGATT